MSPAGRRDVGKFFRAHRQQRRLTQKQVADAVGVSQNAVSSWESGDIHPSPEHLARLLAVLEVPPDDYAALTHESALAQAIDRLAGAIERLASKFPAGCC